VQRRDHAGGDSRLAEGDQHLVEFHRVEDLVTGGAESLGEARRVAAAALNELVEPRAAERAERSPDIDAARAP
jgi:hypothetical protein